MTKDGKYIFSAGQKFLAKNLKSVPRHVLGGDRRHRTAMARWRSARHIFDGTTFSVKRMTPLITTGTMAVSPDDKTLYLYDTTTSRIYIYGLK